MTRFIKIKSIRFAAGVVLAVISLLAEVFFIRQVVPGVILALLFVLAGAVKIDDEVLSDKGKAFVWLSGAVLMSFLNGMLSQYMLGASFLALGIIRMILIMWLYLILMLVAFLVTLHFAWSLSISSAVMMLLTTAEHYVYQFRQVEMMPNDVLAFRTALNVAKGYTFTLDTPVFYGIAWSLLLCFSAFGLPRVQGLKKWKLRLCSAAGAVILSLAFLAGSAPSELKVWGNEGTIQKGYLLNFTLQALRLTFVSKPSGYSADGVEKIAEKYPAEEPMTAKVEQKPDIIVIMDESFADLSVLGSELKTNQPVTPFMDSLSENAIRGHVLVSAFGGGTANSEYEFLTGNSMIFLPVGSVVYQQFIKEPIYSMVGEMKTKGYKCIGMHPYTVTNWMRSTVYNDDLGFDETYFEEDFPHQNTLREFVSDQEMFEKIIELYEKNKAENNSMFLFGVTMQNHGGYDYEGENYQKTISLNGYTQEYSDAEQYLSMIHATDSAVKYLLDYFSKADHEVVVVFYGDHLPSLNSNFYQEVHGGTFDTIEEQQLKHRVPFFIWANYDIPEETVEQVSLNYLSNYVYRAAGLELPAYNRYLDDLQKVIPEVNSVGYYSKAEQRFLSYGKAKGEEWKALYQYQCLMYNSLFDHRNRNARLFPTKAN